jgi:hypothetical protein
MTSNYPAGNETLKQTGQGDHSSLFITPCMLPVKCCRHWRTEIFIHTNQWFVLGVYKRRSRRDMQKIMQRFWQWPIIILKSHSGMCGGHILITVTHTRKQSSDTEVNWEDVYVGKFSHAMYCNKTDVEHMSDFIPSQYSHAWWHF